MEQAPTGAPDPGATGPLAVDELAYDLGAQAFAPTGFPAAVEVRAKVYAPATLSGPAPLIILQHGRHSTCGTASESTGEWPCPPGRPEIPSYRGYDALGRLLASHGAVVASIGANGINANDFASADGGADARGQLVLEHLRLWQQWTAAPGGPFGARFVGRVDLQRVGLMGHSRGGEGVVAAEEINRSRGSPFGVVAVSALAPVDFAARVLPGVALQVVLPHCDGDVSDLQGAAYYDDSRYAVAGDQTAKQTTLLYGANHNFFNTVWTSGSRLLRRCRLPRRPGCTLGGEGCAPSGPGRLAAAGQSAAGATIMGGFLRRFVLGEEDLAAFVSGVAPFPASSGAARWSVAYHGGPRLDVARWADGSDARTDRRGGPVRVRAASPGQVCDAGAGAFSFRGPGDLPGLPPCPDQAGMGATNMTGVLDVGWTRATASVTAGLDPTGTDVSGYDGLRFRLALPPDGRNDHRDRQDLSVRLTDTAGVQATVAVGGATNAVATRPTSSVVHTVLNGVRLPLSAFGGVDLTRVARVELLFDRTTSGRVLVNDLAFTGEGTGDAVGPTQGAVTVATPPGQCGQGTVQGWACAVGAVAWGREPSEGPELAGIAFTVVSPSLRRARIAEIVGGPTAARPVVGRIGQLLLEDGWTEQRYADALRSGRGRWEDAITVLAQGRAAPRPRPRPPRGWSTRPTWPSSVGSRTVRPGPTGPVRSPPVAPTAWPGPCSPARSGPGRWSPSATPRSSVGAPTPRVGPTGWAWSAPSGASSAW